MIDLVRFQLAKHVGSQKIQCGSMSIMMSLTEPMFLDLIENHDANYCTCSPWWSPMTTLKWWLVSVLQPFHPLMKFILVKGIIFFTFWQVRTENCAILWITFCVIGKGYNPAQQVKRPAAFGSILYRICSLRAWLLFATKWPMIQWQSRDRVCVRRCCTDPPYVLLNWQHDLCFVVGVSPI